MVDFAGWEMPVQYTGIIEEHLNVRGSCGIFDVSHMGEIEVSGKGALAFAQQVMTNDVERIVDGQCQYTLLCYPDGGVVDDCIVYRYNRERFLFCVNASNVAKVFDWFGKQAHEEGLLIEDLSPDYAQIALQGPASEEVLRPLIDIDPKGIKHFHFVIAGLKGFDAIVSRTGYTGEDGFEIYLEPGAAAAIWRGLMESGKDYGIKPAGLGARDTLRLEMGYPLYGHELNEKTTPLEAGLKKYVRLEKPSFIGKETLERQSTAGVEKTLIGFTMEDPGIPRQDYGIYSGGRKAGWVTSGTSSPSLKTGIGMGYVEAGSKDAEIGIMIRKNLAKAGITKTPFYHKKK